MFFSISGYVIYRLLLAGDGFVNVIGPTFVTVFTSIVSLTVPIFNVSLYRYKANGRRICHNRACLYIIERVSAFCSKGCNIVRVHVTGKDVLHTGICKFPRNTLVVID